MPLFPQARECRFRQARRVSSVALVVFLFSTFSPILFAQQEPSASIAQTPSSATTPYTVLFSIPKGGKSGVTYAHENTPEMLPQGPRRLMITDDGTFLVFDAAANRLLRYSSSGTFQGTLELPATTLFDTIIYGHELYVVGFQNDQWKLMHLSMDGKVLDANPITPPRSSGMQVFDTLKVNASGDLVLEITDSALRSTVDVPLVSASNVKKAAMNAAVEIHSKDAQTDELNVKGRTIDTIGFHSRMHAFKVFPAHENGAFEARTTEVTDNSAMPVDDVMRSYGPDGKLRGMARPPVAENYISVPESVASGSDGTLYALITRPDGANIVRLSLQKSLSPVAVPSATPATALTASVTVDCSGKTNPDLKTRTRSAMATQANAYLSNSKSLTMRNMDIAAPTRCDKQRTAPSQFVGKKTTTTFPSVPYLWGGYDLPGTFNSAMDSDRVAGNSGMTYPSCFGTSLAGVDCSGFVSRVWNIRQQTTASLLNFSTSINTFNLSTGDILDYPGNHVMLVDRIDGNGAYVWESTVGVPAYGYGKFDGVSYRYYSWSYFLGKYQSYKYQCVS